MVEHESVVIKVSRVLAWIAGLLIVGAAALVSIDVVTRNLFGTTIVESFELSIYAFAIAVTFGMAFTLITKAHIRIEVVYSFFPERVRAILDVLAVVTLSIAALVLVWFTGTTVYDTVAIGARSNTSLGIPMIIPQGLWFAGWVWFALTSLWLTVRAIVHFSRGQLDLVRQEVGVVLLQEEIDHSGSTVALNSESTRG